MFQTIKVHTSGGDSYPVKVGEELWEEFSDFCTKRYSPEKLVIIVDEKVFGLHSAAIREGSSKYFDECHIFRIPEGEQSKSVSQWNKLQDMALSEGIERSTPFLVIGGGVTGDLGGFAASTVLRGVPLLHMPTSLLAMVDSSIGGKTGVNHQTGKNLIGTFYQPDAVFTDIRYLNTLEEKEWINGMSEMLKYAAIQNEELFTVIEKLISRGFEPSDRWTDLIAECIRIKAEIVQKDTKESGIRAYLNFGHTFGHALEKNAGFGIISHGEAVFVGMLAAVYASRQRGATLDDTRFNSFLPFYRLSLTEEAQNIKQLGRLMSRDKKVKDGMIRLILLHDWEEPYIYECKDERLIHEAWKFAFGKINN